jgi:hypothetical protein
MITTLLRFLLVIILFHQVDLRAQTSASLLSAEGYGNLETAGVNVVISGDSNRNASISLEYKRSVDPIFKSAHPLVRFADTRLASSLFGLTAGTNYDFRLTISDPDGVTGSPQLNGTFSTRSDTLIDGTRQLFVAPPPLGNDANNALTASAPVATIQRAANLSQAGDVINIANGVYRETVVPPRSGTASAPIIFRGQSLSAILDGADGVIAAGTTWTSVGGGVYSRTTGFATGLVVSELGRMFRYASVADLTALIAGAPGGYFFDGTVLYVKFADSSAPGAHTLSVARFDHGFRIDGVNNIRIENMSIRHYGSSDFGIGVYLRFANDCVVRASALHENGAAGVWIKGGARHRIEDNTIYDTSIINWKWDLVKGSDAENNGVVLTDNPERGHVIRRNVFYGTFNGIGPCGTTAPASGPTTEVDVYGNSFRYHNDDALEPEGYCSNVRIFNNLVRDSHMAFAVAPANPGPTWIVRNIAYDFGSTRASQQDGWISSALKINSGYPEPVGPVLLYHNTLYSTAPNTNALTFFTPGNSTVITFRNNLIVGTRYVLEKINTVTLNMDYNLLYSSDAARLVKWEGTNYNTLAALQSAQSAELHGYNALPQLLAPAAGDFTPSASSAAIDHAQLLPGINDNFVGVAPDIGAIERGSNDVLLRNGFE